MGASAFFKSHNRAALALHEDFVRYVELDGDLSGLKMRRKLQAPAGGTAVKRDSLADVGALLPVFESIGSSLEGGFKAPVNLGIPSRDILIRVIEMPEMDMENAREALRWDFEKFFPYAYADAAVDIARVDSPAQTEQDKMSVLVAACRLRTVESLMRIAASVGMELNAIEPLNVSMFRAGLGPVSAYSGGYLAVFADKEVSQLVLGYRDNGILYRTSLIDIPESAEAGAEAGKDYGALVREIGNTLTFVKNQYRDLSVDLIMTGGGYGRDAGFQKALEEATGLKTLAVNVWDTWGIAEPDDGNNSWEAAIGLAVRDLL
ncbi:MAG: pilus assembly protein PilM [Synergistaceae bacterium]|nr:pilus assembly protein PilM [Synergistaceae bacterium]